MGTLLVSRSTQGNSPQCNSSNSNAILMGMSPTVRVRIADGDLGTSQTIDRIRRLVRQGMTDQAINRQAIAIVHAAGVREFDHVGEIKALYDWVRRSIRFTRDVYGVETLRTAREVLLVRAGDCDDINGVLLPSLLCAIGHHVRLVTIASNPGYPQEFSHIYCEAELPDGSWLPLDSARRDPAFGRGPQHYFRKRVWSLDDSSHQDMKGLSGYTASPRRIGDDSTDSGFDWSGLAQVISAGGTATANIIRSTTPPIGGINYARNPVTGQLVPISPTGQIIAGTVPGGIIASGSGTIPNWMLYGAFALAAIMVVKK